MSAIARDVRTVGLVAALLLAGVAGCGTSESTGPGSNADQIIAVVDAYNATTADGDAQRFCEDVTALRGSPVDDCVSLVEEAMAASDSDLGTAENVEVLGQPRIDGDSAELRVRDDGEVTTFSFSKEPAGWRLNVTD